MPRKNKRAEKKVNLEAAFKLPPEKAMKYFQSKGFELTWNWHDEMERSHAKAFTVAHVARMDILQDIRGAVDLAIADGQTFREFRKNLEPALRKKGWWGRKMVVNSKGVAESVLEGSPRRLRTIYHTNMKTAYSAGREEFFQKNKAARPYGEYIAVLDRKTRHSHKELHGKVFHLDDPFWDRFTPPLDFNCRCRKRALSLAALNRRGLKLLKSEVGKNLVREDQIVSKKTGEVRKVWGYKLPGGGKIFPGAGFDNNPWKAAWRPDLEKYDYDIAKPYVRESLAGPAFKMFFDGKRTKGVNEKFPVAVMDKDTLALMPAHARARQAVQMEKKRLDHALGDHQDMRIEDMLRVQEAVDDGMVIQPRKKKGRHKREFLLERDGFLWVLPIKETPRTFWKIRIGTENYEQFKKAKLRGKVLREQKK